MADVQSLAMEIAEKLANDDSLQKQTNLRRSITIRSKIRRLWQLMVVESRETREHTPTDDQDLSRATHIAVLHGQSSSPRDRDADGEVTRAGYRMLHMRIAKILIPVGAVNLDGSSAAFDERAAEKLADQDWDDDIARFSGSSHIMTWLDTIRTKFRDASERAVTEHLGMASVPRARRVPRRIRTRAGARASKQRQAEQPEAGVCAGRAQSNAGARRKEQHAP